MKRANYLIEKIVDMDNLRLAFWKASKGKRWHKNVLDYQKDVEKNLLTLRTQILEDDLQVGNYYQFKIFDPKERLISASAFSEQVLHHALMNVCHFYFDRKQIYTSCASRKDKGTSFAIEQAKKYTKKYAFFLKLDIKKYFDSIDHNVLKKQIRNMFKEEKLVGIFTLIIDSYESEKGIKKGVPIGNLTSQYFANSYLASLDHYIKEDLVCKGYVRYMDDMILFDNELSTLKKSEKSIAYYLEKHLECSLKFSIFRKSKLGVPFLGYLILGTHLRLLQKSKRRFLKKYKAIQATFKKGLNTEKQYQNRLSSLFVFIQKAKTKKMRKKILFLNTN